MKKFFDYSWMLIILFFVLGVIDYRFGLLAIICMSAPIYFALKGEGRKGCSEFCPRGSILTKLAPISLRRTAPRWLFSNASKLMVFISIMAVFIYGTYMAWGDMRAIGFVFFRMVVISSIIAFVLGIIYRERTWCVICPMGNMANKITDMKKR